MGAESHSWIAGLSWRQREDRTDYAVQLLAQADILFARNTVQCWENRLLPPTIVCVI